MFCVTLQESNTLLQICRNGLTEKQQKGFAIACLSLDSILVPATTLCVFVLYEDLQKKTRKDRSDYSQICAPNLIKLKNISHHMV